MNQCITRTNDACARAPCCDVTFHCNKQSCRKVFRSRFLDQFTIYRGYHTSGAPLRDGQVSALSDLLLYLPQPFRMRLIHHPDDGGSKLLWNVGYGAAFHKVFILEALRAWNLIFSLCSSGHHCLSSSFLSFALLSLFLSPVGAGGKWTRNLQALSPHCCN
jgi:hypothetical protein